MRKKLIGLVHKDFTAETLQLLLNNFGGIFISIISTVLITRALGPETRGIYAWLLTISTLGASISLLAQYNIIRKLGSEHPGEPMWPTLLGSLSLLNLLGGALSLPILFWSLTQPIGSTHPTLLLLAWLSVPLGGISLVLGTFIHLRKRMSHTLLSNYVPKLISVAIVILAYYQGQLTLEFAIALNILISGIGTLMYMFFLNIPLHTWNFSLHHLKTASRFIGAGWLAGLTLFAMPKLPLILLPRYATLEDIGYFSLATTLLDISFMVPAAVTSVLISHFTRSGHTRTGLQKAFCALTVLVLIMAIGGYLLAPYLVPFLFGADFIASVTPFRLLLLALLLQAPLAVLSSSVTAQGKAWAVVIPPVIGLGASFVLSLIGLPTHGITGACWAIIGGYSVQLLALSGMVAFRR